MKRQNLYEARKKAKMTQEKVARHIGVTKQHYSRLENGQQDGSIDVWDALEDLFQINQRQLRS
jgi:DNA-binding XRE family transcriptional regulator